MQDLNPWSLQYLRRALPTELTHQLELVSMLVPKKPLNWWKNDYEYMETEYVNCEWSREWKRVCTVVCTADHKSVENNMPSQYV